MRTRTRATDAARGHLAQACPLYANFLSRPHCVPRKAGIPQPRGGFKREEPGATRASLPRAMQKKKDPRGGARREDPVAGVGEAARWWSAKKRPPAGSRPVGVPPRLRRMV